MTSRLRGFARQFMPLHLRQMLAQSRRVFRDRLAGIVFSKIRGGEQWQVRIELVQTVMPAALLENKLSNIRRGASLINCSLLEPGGVWSFWNWVGHPSLSNGFVEGRNLVGGRLVLQIGGGLCQLSSLIYHLALQSGLEIVERHAHSIDIYREAERFTPLGSDATVVWGFKDLRLRNPFPFSISIICDLEGVRLTGQLASSIAVPKHDITFVYEDIARGRVLVKTLVNGTEKWLTYYERWQGLQELAFLGEKRAN